MFGKRFMRLQPAQRKKKKKIQTQDVVRMKCSLRTAVVTINHYN